MDAEQVMKVLAERYRRLRLIRQAQWDKWMQEHPEIVGEKPNKPYTEKELNEDS